MNLTEIAIGELAALAIAIMAITGVIGAVVKWVNGNDDKVRLEADRDNRMLEKQVEHASNNNKLSFEAVKNKLDHHNTEITRLTSDQRSMDRAITDMRAELREANHATHKLIEQRIDAVCTMIKEDQETHKDAIRELGQQHRASVDAMVESFRDFRASSQKA